MTAVVKHTARNKPGTAGAAVEGAGVSGIPAAPPVAGAVVAGALGAAGCEKA